MPELTKIAILCTVAMGMRLAMLDGMVLGRLGALIEKVPSAYWRKPLGTCERCMVSTYGTAALAILDMMPVWYQLPIYWLAAAGLQELLDR